MTTSDERTQRQLAQLASDPLQFIQLCWPHIRLYDKQRDILLSVRDNVETLVHAANQMGKDFVAALTTLWFFSSRTPARVITSSSCEAQLNSILWTEIAHLIETSSYPLPLRVSSLRIEKRKDPQGKETEPRDYIIGHVTNSVENFQGHHLPGDKPRVLCIFDEASGIADPFNEAADSWAHRKLVIGNPLGTTNFFYFNCKAGDQRDPAGGPGLLRKVIHIDGRDSPNVRLGMRLHEAGQEGPCPVLIPGLLTYEEYLRRQHSWDEVQRTTRLDGRFYEGDQALMFPMAWLDAAAARFEKIADASREAVAIGVDGAQGRDLTCWTVVDSLGIIEQIARQTPNTMDIAGETAVRTAGR